MKKPIPFGKYYLLERINVGGMAEVFRAKAYGVEGFERLVAVKRILPNIAEDKEFIKMFIDEAKIAVQLNHANVAQIFDLGMVDGSYYIALEHIHGRDLRAIFDRCRNQGEPMPIAQACFAVMKVCEGLDYAHNKRDQGGVELNLVHRDVSPQNILVSFEGEVKLIDFGIAKAAGKGSKTQAGILKGKFGYMSPEQVRGLPIDRRSDIFACGIVLYELLTGERLFVGESDFSTLEKVRNVEILPPSTYNRKIPDELERIALKALAKDVEDRYQNAIDLHDELQAFVYTAGEFYSRKDLAAWMKRMFHKEIEAETAKLEEYRRLRPPDQKGSQSRPPSVDSDSRARTGGHLPPPIPGLDDGPIGADSLSLAEPEPIGDEAAGLEWDDEELETTIYDNDSPAGGLVSSVNGGAGPFVPPLAASAGFDSASPHPEPDLSSLVPPAKGWDTPPPISDTRGASLSPPTLANGSNNGPAPYGGMPSASRPLANADPIRESSAVSRLVDMAEPIFESGYRDGLLARDRDSSALVWLLIAGVIIAAVSIAVILMTGSSDQVAVPDRPSYDLSNTGFDLYLEPSNLGNSVTVKLDGKIQNTPVPMKIRNLTAGDHTVSIDAPPGYLSKSETVTVGPGEAGRVTIRLLPSTVTGLFRSIPEGATVTVIADGVRQMPQMTPYTTKLNPKKKYTATFEMPGYQSKTVDVQPTGGTAREEVVAELTPTEAPPVARKRARSTTKPIPGAQDAKDDTDDTSATTTDDDDEGDDKPAVEDPDEEPSVARRSRPRPTRRTSEMGILMLGSRPPCRIYVDGRDTGQMTPQRELRLPVGRHKITLVNNEHNIKETFRVVVKAGKPTKVIKNLIDQMR